MEARRDFGHAATLEARALELLLRGQPRAVATGHGRHAVGRAAAHDIVAHLALIGIGKRHDDHAVMLEGGLRGDQGEFLPAMLRRRRGYHRADLVEQRALRPERSGLVEEVLHLRGHRAETGREREDDAVIVLQFLRTGDRGFLVELVVGCLGDVRGTSSGTRLIVTSAPASARLRPRPSPWLPCGPSSNNKGRESSPFLSPALRSWEVVDSAISRPTRMWSFSRSPHRHNRRQISRIKNDRVVDAWRFDRPTKAIPGKRNSFPFGIAAKQRNLAACDPERSEITLRPTEHGSQDRERNRNCRHAGDRR